MHSSEGKWKRESGKGEVEIKGGGRQLFRVKGGLHQSNCIYFRPMNLIGSLFSGQWGIQSRLYFRKTRPINLINGYFFDMRLMYGVEVVVG